MSFQQDFQPPRNTFSFSRGRRRRRSFTLVARLAVCALAGAFLVNSFSSIDPQPDAIPDEMVAATSPATVPPPPQSVPHEIEKQVQPGETITALLGDYFTPKEIYTLNLRSKDVFPFARICAGRPYCIRTIDDEFERFIYEIDAEEQLVISREADDIRMEREPILYDVQNELVQGAITTSLFGAIAECGEQPELAYVLADIFGWDINFILDLRVGDTFQAFVEKRFRDGQPAGYGHVLAAEFVNQKKRFRAIRYQDGKNKPSYYNEQGENLQKAFLKAPLSFTRISSGYTMRRLHPIKKVYRPHPAIDYAAPVGTPVKTVGDGSISRKGYGRGNGNYLEVRHSNGYKSMYLHLNGFARRIAKGSRVTQGQVIGYVGNTGMSTGPHLDFRMTHHGRPVNPLKLKAPSAKSVSKKNLHEFQALAKPLLARLKGEVAVQVAKATKPETGIMVESTQ